MVMNFSANLLGLDNAATPFGLKAMESLQTLNPNKDEATNAQIMFLVLHTSGLTLIPLAIMAQRSILGAADPSGSATYDRNADAVADRVPGPHPDSGSERHPAPDSGSVSSRSRGRGYSSP